MEDETSSFEPTCPCTMSLGWGPGVTLQPNSGQIHILYPGRLSTINRSTIMTHIRIIGTKADKADRLKFAVQRLLRKSASSKRFHELVGERHMRGARNLIKCHSPFFPSTFVPFCTASNEAEASRQVEEKKRKRKRALYVKILTCWCRAQCKTL